MNVDLGRLLLLQTLLALLGAPGGAAGAAAFGAATPTATPSTAPGPASALPDEDDLDDGWASPREPDSPPRPAPITLLLDWGAYYSSAGLYLPLTDSPTPNVGESNEAEIYASLFRRALRPRYLVLEASVNPMPCLGLAARDWSWGYRRADLTPEFNVVRVLTAGFE
jgi:hypothetical protein